MKSYPVAVFAHNEESNIVRCLDSLDQGAGLDIFVLANGCSDGTVARVRRYALDHPEVRVVELERGDKASAWNAFVHGFAPDNAETCYFIDGDVRAGEGALGRLARALERNPEAHVAAAIPGSGRNRRAQLDEQIETHGVQGNLYAVRGSFLSAMRREQLRLPAGFVRDDGLLGALAKWDLSPFRGAWNPDRVIVVTDARFLFDPVEMFSPKGIRQYWNRKIRYSIGHFETSLLKGEMKARGLTGIPADVLALYGKAEMPKLRWRGVDTLFDWMALMRIARIRNRYANPKRGG